MIPRAKDLRKLWFESPEALYGRFNYQRDEQIDALMELLVDSSLPAVVVLGGKPGIGRGFLCDAAAHRARTQGHKVAVWHLDLDGFEPDVENPLTQYLRHLIDQEERQQEAAREKAKGAVKSAAKTLIKLDLVGQASELAASLLSLLWQFEDPLERFAALLNQPRRGSSAPPRDDPDTLHRFLIELTRDRKLLVHITDGPQLTSNLRRWLIGEVERAPERLLLVISCPLDQVTARAAPEARSKPERFDVLPLDAAELRALLDRRFDPNELPDDLVEALMRRCHGRAVAIANQLADLMEAEILVSEGETWRLPPAGLKDPQLVYAFSRGLFEEVDKPLATLAEEEPELARALRDLLSLAALCGRYVPMAALLEHLQLNESTAEAAIDWVDDVLVGELGWLNDLGFKVIGFPGHNAYTFTHPLLPLVVLDQELEVTREMRAATLLRFLEQRIHLTKRGWARCFLSIAEHLGGRECEPYERSLAWWIGLEAADALRAEIRIAIECEEIEPELVWRMAKDSETWPAYRRLAVLEAYAQATIGEGAASRTVVPFDRFADFHLLRASLLIDVGRYADSLADSQDALKLVPREPLKRSRALNLSGVARLYLGDGRASRLDFEAAVVLDDEIYGEEHPNTLTARHNLASALREVDDLEGARKLEETILEIRTRVLGAEHPHTLQSKDNLALTLRALGDLEGAWRLQEQTLESRERVLGGEHPDTLASMTNVAAALHAFGNCDGARKLNEQTLEIKERVLGSEHPSTLDTRNNLAEVLRALGDLEGARRLQEQTVALRERVLGHEHPDTLSSRHNLAGTLTALGDLGGARVLQEQVLEILEQVLGAEHRYTSLATWNLLLTVRDLNDLKTEAQIIDKLRWLLDRDEHSIPSANQRAIRQGLLDFLNRRAQKGAC
ncbi:MAG TPA: tetratricopeptide repeat protein [Thermoanaerobaculia bacterium]|jgi:tetratricopeptide (TPR) repeat protein|nr:tetratricopeptide repeat protein [Thermoanaerobaculia bacterium]